MLSIIYYWCNNYYRYSYCIVIVIIIYVCRYVVIRWEHDTSLLLTKYNNMKYSITMEQFYIFLQNWNHYLYHLKNNQLIAPINNSKFEFYAISLSVQVNIMDEACIRDCIWVQLLLQDFNLAKVVYRIPIVMIEQHHNPVMPMVFRIKIMDVICDANRRSSLCRL